MLWKWSVGSLLWCFYANWARVATSSPQRWRTHAVIWSVRTGPGVSPRSTGAPPAVSVLRVVRPTETTLDRGLCVGATALTTRTSASWGERRVLPTGMSPSGSMASAVSSRSGWGSTTWLVRPGGAFVMTSCDMPLLLYSHHIYIYIYINCTVIRHDDLQKCGKPPTCFSFLRPSSGTYSTKKNASG